MGIGLHRMTSAKLAGLLIALLVATTGVSVRAASGALSQEDQQCLACHGAKGLEKKLGNGETLSLHVDGSAFAGSAHSMLGCPVCHADVTLQNHPPLKKKIASVRENSVAMMKVCRTCHGETFKQYEGSTHAALLREGSPAAPLCTDCHGPHAIKAKAAYDEATGAPCSNCHSSIFEAYAGSVHGQARKHGSVGAASCSNCHGAHEVKGAAAEEQVRDTCHACHPAALSAHQKWLPNAGRHLRTVSCAACHAPGAKRKVDLRLYDSDGKERIAQKEGVPQFDAMARAIDTEGKGLNALALQSLLREFSRDGMGGKVIVRGRLEVDGSAELHQLADKSRAVAQCETCHRSGSAPFQKVSVSIAGADGRPVRYGASKEVLSSVFSVDSIGGFYVIGGTRIALLDVLVILALLGGIGTPIAHLTMGWLFRRYAKRISGREDS
ncbi:MAG TPA: multiheme c-type cytochrome [Burkholderiales bacterium]